MRKVRLAAVLAAAVIVAGCSSNDAPPEKSSTPRPGPWRIREMSSRTRHFGSAGTGAGPPPGTDEATWHKATQACASMAPGPDAG